MPSRRRVRPFYIKRRLTLPSDEEVNNLAWKQSARPPVWRPRRQGFQRHDLLGMGKAARAMAIYVGHHHPPVASEGLVGWADSMHYNNRLGLVPEMVLLPPPYCPPGDSVVQNQQRVILHDHLVCKVGKDAWDGGAWDKGTKRGRRGMLRVNPKRRATLAQKQRSHSTIRIIIPPHHSLSSKLPEEKSRLR